jgi:hypothetical protein
MSSEPTLAPRLTVTFELAGIVHGGDAVGNAEIYFEGWVDDGQHKKPFRIPHSGHIPEVADGQTLTLNTVIFEGRPKGHMLTVHVEAWDEDLGRQSSLNPDDLLGVYERAFTAEERWGVGRHENITCKTDAGEWLLTFNIAAAEE